MTTYTREPTTRTWRSADIWRQDGAICKVIIRFFGECNVAFWKTHKCKLIPNWTRKTVWLLINNINMKNLGEGCFELYALWTLFSVLCAGLTSGDFNYHAIRKNCAIQGTRLIWKQKIWLAICELLCSLTNENACFITFFCIQLPLFCTVLRKTCSVLSQSESSHFFMYIISSKNRKIVPYHGSARIPRLMVSVPDFGSCKCITCQW